MKKSECRKLKCHRFDGIACHLVSESYSGAAKEIERLRYELSAVKEEFKAVTGFDFRDSL